MSVELLSTDELNSNKSFEWEFEKVKAEEVEIKITFKEPLNISHSAEKDRLRITFKDTTQIFDVFGQEITTGTVLER